MEQRVHTRFIRLCVINEVVCSLYCPNYDRNPVNGIYELEC